MLGLDRVSIGLRRDRVNKRKRKISVVGVSSGRLNKYKIVLINLIHFCLHNSS